MVFSPVLPIRLGRLGDRVFMKPPAFQTPNPGVWHQGRGDSTAVAVGPFLPVSYSSAKSFQLSTNHHQAMRGFQACKRQETCRLSWDRQRNDNSEESPCCFLPQSYVHSAIDPSIGSHSGNLQEPGDGGSNVQETSIIQPRLLSV